MTTKTNLELSQDFYKESFYKIIKTLMNEFGWFIHKDLTFLLRQVTLSRIACIRSNTEYIKNKHGIDLKFNEDLDPFEAVDMFISYPQCPEFDKQMFYRITQGWEHKYGTKVTPYLSELFLAIHRNERYLLKNMFDFINGTLGENFDLSSTTYTSEQLITNMTKDSQSNEEISLEEELENLTSSKLHEKYLSDNLIKFATSLSEEQRTIFFGIQNSSNRIAEKFLLDSLNCAAKDLNQQLKTKFGDEHEVTIDLKFKYIDPINPEEEMSFNYASSNSIVSNILTKEAKKEEFE